MKKNRPKRTWLRKTAGHNALRTLLCLFCVVAVSITATANVLSQSLDINVRNASLEQVLIEIQQKSSYDVAGLSDKIRSVGNITLSMKGATVEQVLNESLRGTNLSYRIENNTIRIYEQAAQNQQQGQTVTVTGIVKDSRGMTLPGVTILVKGTRTGFVTDTEGRFSARIPAGDQVLVLSFIGFKTQEIAVKNQRSFDITMKEDVAQIDEVVITGVFNMPKESFTGAVSHITKEELDAFRGRNFLQTLGFIDPSFNILENNNSGSDPNTLPEIQIRGVSSLPDIRDLQFVQRADVNTPLFILDGFEISLERVMDINDAEVESVTILKDASATSVYGSRGANGVVVITSIRPHMGKLRVNYQGSSNFEIPSLSSYNLMNAQEKLDVEVAAGVYEPLGRKVFYQQVSRAVAEGVDTYWIGKPVRVGVGQTHTLSMTGGDETFRYTLAGSYNNVAGAMKGSLRDVVNGSISLTYMLKKLRFDNTISITKTKGEASPYGSFSDYVKLNPYWHPYDSDGKMVSHFQGIYGSDNTNYYENPLYNARLNSFNTTKYTSFTENFRVNWDAFEFLRFDASIGYTWGSNDIDNFISPGHTMFSSSEPSQKGRYTWTHGTTETYEIRLGANFVKNIEDHNISAGVQANLRETNSLSRTIIAQGFTNDYLSELGYAGGYMATRPSSSERTIRNVGLSTYLSYIYGSRYFLNASFRLDGASSFGPEKRFAPFWSVGVGWTVSNENFIKDNVTWIDNLRFIANYGVVSNLNFSPYQAMATYKLALTERYRGGDIATLEGLANDELRWQDTKETNVGFEFDLLGNKLTIEGNYYIRETVNMLATLGLKYSHGFSGYSANMGTLRNTGYDLKVSVTPIKSRDITWMVSGTFYHNKNVIKKLSDDLKAQNEAQRNSGIASGATGQVYLQYREGQSMDAIYLPYSPGVDPATGYLLYVNRYGETVNHNDPRAMVYCGNSQPKLHGSFQTMLRYKNLSFNAAFSMRTGGQKLNATLMDRVENAYLFNNMDKRVLSTRWQKPGDVVAYRAITSDVNTMPNSRFVQNESTLECNTINVRYDIPRRICERMGMERLSVTTGVTSPFYWSTIDQERGTSYPYAIRPTFSLSCTF